MSTVSTRLPTSANVRVTSPAFQLNKVISAVQIGMG